MHLHATSRCSHQDLVALLLKLEDTTSIGLSALREHNDWATAHVLRVPQSCEVSIEVALTLPYFARELDTHSEPRQLKHANLSQPVLASPLLPAHSSESRRVSHLHEDELKEGDLIAYDYVSSPDYVPH